MENARLFLFMGLALVMLMLYQAWQQDYASPAASPAPAQAAATSDLPSPQTAPVPAADMPGAPAADVVPADNPAEQTITVETDLLRLDISLTGGTIVRSALKAFPVELDTPNDPLLLLTSQPGERYVAQSGLVGSADNPAVPDHRARYEAAASSYSLGEADTLEVELTWASAADGTQVSKVFLLRRGSYEITVQYRVRAGSEALSLRQYHQLQRHFHKQRRGMVPTFTGAAFSNPEEVYEKYDFDDLDEDPVQGTYEQGWVAMMQHYFLTALVPPAGAPATFYSKKLPDEHYLVGFYGESQRVEAGTETLMEGKLFIGPKQTDRLEKVAPHLELAIDYGVLWFLSKPLSIILDWMHDLTANWGWAIILLTIIVKAAFFYPSAMGYRSMAKMRKVTPRMQQIKERYADDKMRQQQAMMELFKQEKINPLGGCFPILIQIPVFIALYWVLLESVDLRHAPFMLWLRDLSAPDPLFILPLIMGATMFFQQKLNPAPMDPVQAKVMQFLPIIFTVMFAFFPAGLVLYWTVSNILSIAQQWVITRNVEQG